MSTQFTAHVVDINNKTIATRNSHSSNQLMLKLLQLLDILPLGTQGIIYDNFHRCVVGQYSRRTIE